MYLSYYCRYTLEEDIARMLSNLTELPTPILTIYPHPRVLFQPSQVYTEEDIARMLQNQDKLSPEEKAALAQLVKQHSYNRA